mgnify:CR=1 FL=1
MDLETYFCCFLVFLFLNFISMLIHNSQKENVELEKTIQGDNNESSAFVNSMIWMNQGD